MPPDLAPLSTLTGSNYPCLELIFMVPKVFKPLKFDCISSLHPQQKQLVLNNYSFLSYVIKISVLLFSLK